MLDQRCLRGLKVVFRAPERLCRICLADRLDEAFPSATRAVEMLGAVTVQARVVPFVAELRWGMRPGEVELVHRFTSSKEERERSHANVAAALHRALGCTDH